jgi:hypothetical protein
MTKEHQGATNRRLYALQERKPEGKESTDDRRS